MMTEGCSGASFVLQLLFNLWMPFKDVSQSLESWACFNSEKVFFLF